MELGSVTGVAACCSGVVMALSPLLQARRVRIARDSDEVSSGLFMVMRINSTLWVAHGLATGDPVLVVPNAVAFVTSAVTLTVIRRYSRAERR